MDAAPLILCFYTVWSRESSRHGNPYQAPAFLVVFGALVLLTRSLPDGSRGRRHFVRFTAAVVVLLLGFFVVPYSDTWLRFATWFRGLPIAWA